jgi:2-oxoglutarate dehydrogenase E2 component (dihydrolipoamide succinyltransferase)
MKREVKVPSVGESIQEAQIGAWLKAEGELVGEGDPLFELESEKASMSVPSPAAGRLELVAPAGAEVKIGQVVAYIDTDAQTAPIVRPPIVREPVPREPSEGSPGTAEAEAAPRFGEAPPSVDGTTSVEAPPPTIEARSQDGIERSPLSMIRKTIARRLVEARRETAHLTTFNEVDMSEVMRIRASEGEAFAAKNKVKLGFMSFFVKAAVSALQAYPIVNSRIEGDQLLKPDFYDIGVAVATERGLLVPVLRDADRLSFGEVEAALAELASRAREGKIALAELQGGSFTITNGGTFGSMLSTPIPNYPQSAILGMHAIQKRPVVVGDQVAIRPMMYLALTYDHRLIDGREAVLFLVRIKDCIEHPERLILGL